MNSIFQNIFLYLLLATFDQGIVVVPCESTGFVKDIFV